MSRMDYEKARRHVKHSDHCFDDLPPTGSWADRRRFMAEQAGSRGQSSDPNCRAKSNVIILSSEQQIVQLEMYLVHAEHPDFARKAQMQKTEVISIIRKLLDRLSIGSRQHSANYARVAARANKLITRHSH